MLGRVTSAAVRSGVRSYGNVQIKGVVKPRYVPKEPRSTAEQSLAAWEDCGTPVVADEIAIPYKSYQEEFHRQNKIFNKVLAASVTFFLLTSFYAWKYDIFATELDRPPKAWYAHTPRPEKYKLE